MPDKLTKLISEVLELDKKATPGEWEVEPNYIRVWAPKYKLIAQHSVYDASSKAEMTVEDAELIVHYRTSAPKLAKACEYLYGLAKSISADYQSCPPDKEWANAALAKVEKILEEK